jgi:hypothetical protein
VLSLCLVRVPALRTSGSSNAGQSFGAAAAACSAVVLFYMARTMRMQEVESEMQRQVLQAQQEILRDQCEETQLMKGELHRTSEALVRALHISLLQTAMGDPDLSATWPSLADGMPEVRRKQFLYINQVLSFHYMAFDTGGYSESAIEAVLRPLFTVPVWREFWERNRDDRMNRVPCDSAEFRFSLVVQRAYEAAAATTAMRRQA